MKRSILLLSAFALVVTLAACGAKHEHASAPAKEATKLSADYPLDVCVVSGEKLSGQMGATVVINYKGQEVGLCCKDCVGDFNKDPEKYIAIINDAKAKKAAASTQSLETAPAPAPAPAAQ